ncbi:hypothetical protein POSPLADRAFT_1036949 [Postia placenta MAD-698-R-SB12]|uniref:Uncharacterized protein n=1 Tax=Postia placenta MAD-698-R-SB12 TaxID=670580 RepID=A0A1X6MME7_9APHY|nr:hypothetical protein POSPLADRAFT_1036949 [Postia placenta MAD-698-R-SB12]OSX57508.1 hypothetical protein POSPLADRAFT_1036949 [Postia placenta MAD-698-R-SB12]
MQHTPQSHGDQPIEPLLHAGTLFIDANAVVADVAVVVRGQCRCSGNNRTCCVREPEPDNTKTLDERRQAHQEDDGERGRKTGEKDAKEQTESKTHQCSPSNSLPLVPSSAVLPYPLTLFVALTDVDLDTRAAAQYSEVQTASYFRHGQCENATSWSSGLRSDSTVDGHSSIITNETQDQHKEPKSTMWKTSERQEC